MSDAPVRAHMAAEGIDAPLPPVALSHAPIAEIGLLVLVETAIIKMYKAEVRDE